MSSDVESPPIEPGSCVTVENRARCHDDGDLVRLGLRNRFGPQPRHVRIERDVGVDVGLAAGPRFFADGFANALAHRVARQKLVDEPVVHGEARRVPADLAEQRHDVVGVLLQRRRGQSARRRHVGLVGDPQRVEEDLARLLVLRRHVVTRDGSTNDLYSPTVRTLYVDEELVERRLVVRQEPAVTVDEDESHRVHVDVVGLRGEVVLIARETVADGDDGLAALLEADDLRGYLLELAQTRTRHSVEIENDGLDALVVARSTQRVDDVADERLLQRRLPELERARAEASRRTADRRAHREAR